MLLSSISKEGNEMKRILAFTLIFAMLFTAMLGIMPAAEGEAAKLEITHANLEFASNVYLLVAVNYTGVCADEAEALEKVYITVGGDKVTDYCTDSCRKCEQKVFG